MRIPCFLRGSRIATDDGDVPVEDLSIGAKVLISGGAYAPIKFIGRRQLFNDNDRWPESVEPIVIRKGALKPGLPGKDLWLSPEHAILLDGLLYTAFELVDGRKVVRLGRTDMRQLEYFHVDLGFHDVIYAEGLATESFGGGNWERFDNYNDYVRLYGATEQPPYAPFAPRGYQLAGKAAHLGLHVAERLPNNVRRLGRPLARATYSAVGALERAWVRKRVGNPRDLGEGTTDRGREDSRARDL